MSGRLDLINDGTTSTTVIHDEQGRVVEIHAADRITRYGYCR
jgi:YD repeat-containing protein